MVASMSLTFFLRLLLHFFTIKLQVQTHVSNWECKFLGIGLSNRWCFLTRHVTKKDVFLLAVLRHTVMEL